MANDLEATAHFIDAEITQLRSDLLSMIASNMNKYGIVVSGQLKNATSIKTDSLADDLIGGLELTTLKYGIMLQSTKKFVVKAPVENIIEWIKLLGVAKFKLEGKTPTED